METPKVTCCTCDKHQHIYNTAKIKLPGLTQDFYICNNCLTSLPALKPETLEPPVKTLVNTDAA
jgi:hypothetical protein